MLSALTKGELIEKVIELEDKLEKAKEFKYCDNCSRTQYHHKCNICGVEYKEAK